MKPNEKDTATESALADRGLFLKELAARFETNAEKAYADRKIAQYFYWTRLSALVAAKIAGRD